MELAFEDLCSRFDLFLARLNRSGDDTQRGLIVLDKSTSETALQKMSVRFRTEGTRWGNIRNLTETPLFVDSRGLSPEFNSRIILPIRCFDTSTPKTCGSSIALATNSIPLGVSTTGCRTRSWATNSACAPVVSRAEQLRSWNLHRPCHDCFRLPGQRPSFSLAKLKLGIFHDGL